MWTKDHPNKINYLKSKVKKVVWMVHSIKGQNTIKSGNKLTLIGNIQMNQMIFFNKQNNFLIVSILYSGGYCILCSLKTNSSRIQNCFHSSPKSNTHTHTNLVNTTMRSSILWKTTISIKQETTGLTHSSFNLILLRVSLLYL